MKRLKEIRENEKGSAVFLTMVIILALLVLMRSAIDIAYNQYEISHIQKQTSNAYYLAEAGIEKAVDTLNEAMVSQSHILLEQVRGDMMKALGIQNKNKKQKISIDKGYERFTDYKYLNWYPEEVNADGTKGIFKPNSQWLTQWVQIRSMQSLIQYMWQAKSQGQSIDRSDIIWEQKYYTKSDEGMSDQRTEVVVKAKIEGEIAETILEIIQQQDYEEQIKLIENLVKKCPEWYKDLITIEATATVGDISQSATAQIDLLQAKQINGSLNEKYKWTSNPPDLLNSAIVCFSDFVVRDGAKVTVEGDLSVKGSKLELAPGNKVRETDQLGGVIVNNSGTLKVQKPREYEKVTHKSNNTGSIYTLGNVIVTNGWEKGKNYSATTSLDIEGNVVANTVGILDDFFDGEETINHSPWNPEKQGSGLSIKVGESIFVEDDVRIDKYIKGSRESEKSHITVDKMIVGIGDGRINNPSDEPNPNTSSGVFNLGQEHTLIRAYGMMVNGQPFITFDSGESYHKLYESIGEPYEDVYSLSEYRQSHSTLGNPRYLLNGKEEDSIKSNKIQIDSLPTSGVIKHTPYIYAPGAISAMNTQGIGEIYITGHTELGDGDNPEAILKQEELRGFSQNIESSFNPLNFYNKPFKLSEVIGGDEVFDPITEQPLKYYQGNYTGQEVLGYPFMQHKDFGLKEYPLIGYRGVQAFMTAARNVFYGPFVGNNPSQLTFDKVVKMQEIKTSEAWRIESPIEIITSPGEVTLDINNYYDEGMKEAIPTIILVTNPYTTLRLITTGQKQFDGVIISVGNIVIEESMDIEGSVIVGGTSDAGQMLTNRNKLMRGEEAGILIQGSKTEVKFTHNPDMLLKVNFVKVEKLRKILDVLKITSFNKKVEKVGEYNQFIKVGENGATDRVEGESTYKLFENTSYTLDRIKLDDTSTLILENPGLALTIQMMKKVDTSDLTIQATAINK